LRQDCGVQRGDRVAILMSQSPDTAATHMATYKLGAIAVPLFVLFKAEALEYRLRDSGARVVVVEPSSLEVVRSIQKNLPNLKHIIVCPPMSAFTTVPNMPKAAGVHSMTTLVEGSSSDFQYVNTLADDPALIIYTSGTTGKIKSHVSSSSSYYTI
jgi:acetyl-CoA synthetase